MTISIDDILDTLVSRGGFAPSTMGAQLERLATGVVTAPDPFRARNEAENNILAQAGILRAISEFTGRREFRERFETLKKIQRSSYPNLDQGYIAISILRAYQERVRGTVKERALVAVYQYIGSIAPDVVPPPPNTVRDVLDLEQAFRENTAKRARSVAAEAYADSYLALESFLRAYNKRATRLDSLH